MAGYSGTPLAKKLGIKPRFPEGVQLTAKLHARALRSALAKMKHEGAIWVSWPLALPIGLVDFKVCAMDETWSALKLVLRKEKRKPR
jgi:hypothetical protein